jgi:tripartite motif-containing protein 71
MITHYRYGIILCLSFVLLATVLATESTAQITFKQSVGAAGTAGGQFDGPFGNAISKTGYLYVADYKNHRVQVFGADGVFKFTFGSEGTIDGLFKYPVDVAFHINGDLYVLQSDKVQIFTAAGAFIRKFSVTSGYGLAMDPAGDIFVIGAFEIMKYKSDGTLLKQWGTYGKAVGQFDNAYDGVVDRYGRLYVVEVLNHRIQVFTRDGEFITAFGTEGSADGKLKYPAGVAVDAVGNIYVADQGNHRIQIFNLDGELKKKFGSIGSTEGKFQNPIRVTLDEYGKFMCPIIQTIEFKFFRKQQMPLPALKTLRKPLVMSLLS